MRHVRWLLALTLAACSAAPPDPTPGVFVGGDATLGDLAAIKRLQRQSVPDQAALFDVPKDGDLVTAPPDLAWHVQGGPSTGKTFFLDVRSQGEALLEIVTDEPHYAAVPEAFEVMKGAAAVEICAVTATLFQGEVVSGPFAGSWVTFEAD